MLGKYLEPPTVDSRFWLELGEWIYSPPKLTRSSAHRDEFWPDGDSPSDDADSESGEKSKRKMADRGQSDEDDLDKLDAKIEQQEEGDA